jgi:outer membrane protein assembly factor BamB
VVIAGGISPHGPTAQILIFDPATQRVTRLGTLPAPVSHAPAVALGRFVYVVGGRAANGAPTEQVFAIDSQTGNVSVAAHLPRPLSDSAAVPFAGGILTAGGRGTDGTVEDVFGLSPAPRPATMATTPLLRPGSDPSVLPGNVLIADKANNRLIEVSPQGKIVWSFPKPGRLEHGQTFKVPDDAFFTPNGRQIVATEEDDFVISVIDMESGRIVYRYGHPGTPGSGPGYVHNPDDAIMLQNGRIVSADIKNCRLIELKPPLHHTIAQMGTTRDCGHHPPTVFGSPNGAFPLRGGGIVVTEINGDWIDVFSRSGKLVAASNPPGFTYPSDTNEVRPGVYLTVDYVQPGAIEKLTGHGRLLWHFAPRGKDALNHPSLALPLSNGDVLANDDYNHRVIVVDPREDRIVWQYGHTGVSGKKPGYLNTPDGVDLAPPHSLIDNFTKARGLPPQTMTPTRPRRRGV